MRASWEALHAGLVRSVRTLEADNELQEARQHYPQLAPFNDPGAVIAYLTGDRGDRDAKDQLLATLVEMVQARDAAELASSLLWLGLWPGLDAVFRRRLASFSWDADELVSELSAAFTQVIAELNLDTVCRVAASLVRSTERTLLEGRARAWRDVCRCEPLDERRHAEALNELSKASFGGGDRDPRSLAAEVASLRRWLVSVVGADSDLLLSVAVLDESQREAAERLGLTYEAARKRLQRALRRIRQEIAEGLSHSHLQLRVCHPRVRFTGGTAE